MRTEIFNSKDKRGLTPLHKAAGLGNQEIVEFLLDLVDDRALLCRDSLGRTPLHYSVLSEEFDQNIYDYLVEKGADAGSKDVDNLTPQDYINKSVKDPILKKKLMEVPEAPRLGMSGRKSPAKSPKRGASPAKTRDNSPSKVRSKAAGSKIKKEEKSMALVNPIKVSKSQIQEWAKAGSVNKLEQSLLMGHRHLILNIGKVWNEEVRNFIKKVPELITKIDEVHEYVSQNNSEALAKVEDNNLLLSRDEAGVSPILKASEQGNVGLVNLILSRVGQAAKTVDHHGNTALDYALKCSDEEIREQLTQLLVSKGADKKSKTAGSKSQKESSEAGGEIKPKQVKEELLTKKEKEEQPQSGKDDENKEKSKVKISLKRCY